MERRLRTVALVIATPCIAAPALARGPLSFEERVKAQEAIERVYYNHRVWPKENLNAGSHFSKEN